MCVYYVYTVYILNTRYVNVYEQEVVPRHDAVARESKSEEKKNVLLQRDEK